MGPPLKSRFPWIIPDALQAPRFGRSTFPPVTPCSIDRALPGGGSMVTCLRATGGANSLSRRAADGSKLRHVPALPVAGPGLGRRKASARTLCSPSASVTQPCFLSALPVTGAGGAFLPHQGLGVFRHSRVSEKRSQTLSPHFSPIPGNGVGGRAEWDFHGLGRQRLSVGPP